MYRCDVVVENAAGSFMQSLADNDAGCDEMTPQAVSSLQEMLLKSADYDLGSISDDEFLASGGRRGAVIDFQAGFLNAWSAFFDELVTPSRSNWPCMYFSSSSITLVVPVADAARLPSAASLHGSLTTLQAECQTRHGVPAGGKDYGGSLNISYSGKPCVLWKDVELYDVDSGYTQGNAYRNDNPARYWRIR